MASSGRWRTSWLAVCLVLALALAPAPAGAQPPARPLAVPPERTASVQTGLELSVPVSQALQRLQEQWLQWMGAFYQGNQAHADAALASLLGTALQIGMKRLPDLSLAAGVRAVEVAREGKPELAKWALDAAEKLDPGRPETAFTGATVAGLDHRWVLAAQRYAQGYARTLDQAPLRLLLLEQALLWGCSSLLVAGGLFVALQMATKGSALAGDAHELLRRRMPSAAAYVTVALLLLWPLLLPGGVFWLALYWSVFLWGYGSLSERAVLCVLWLVAAIVPMVLADQQRRVALELSPPARAVGVVLERRLSGSLFNDIGVLRSALPHSTATLQFTADLHRILGQWDFARSVYNKVLEAEPKNAAALIDLGAFYFRKSEFAKAVDYYRRAAEADPRDATPFFNLSVAYSESYQFDESRRALSQAQALDERRVGNWIQTAPPERVVTVDGGLDRAREIRAEFEATRRDREAPTPPWRAFLPLVVSGLAAALAVGLHFLRRRRGYCQPEVDLTQRDEWSARALRVMVPGLAASEDGAGGTAFGLVLLPVSLLLLPLASALGWRLPWGYEAGHLLGWVTALLGLSLFFGLRWRRELRQAAVESGD